VRDLSSVNESMRLTRTFGSLDTAVVMHTLVRSLGGLFALLRMTKRWELSWAGNKL